MEYEICYLVGESNEANLEKIKEEVEGIISQEGGKILPAEKIEKRKMAYKIKKEIRGIYVARRFEMEKNEDDVVENVNAIDDITKKLNLKNEVLRFMIIKADELPSLVKKEEGQVEENKKSERVEMKKQEKNPEEKSEKPKKQQKSIDDKLEEILNI